jgi:uncharacterized protein (DUF1810 family)
VANKQEAEDPFDLSRFVFAQESVFDTALRELQRGQKTSHWMWFIFPQLEGLGRSSMAKKYAIRGLDEARAYLRHPVLGPRLLECCRAILSVEGKSASEIMGDPDDMKLKSSMTLFSLVEGAPAEFREVLLKFYGGEQDEQTVGRVVPGTPP